MKRKKYNIKLLLSMVLCIGSFSGFAQVEISVDEHEKDEQCVTEEHYQQFLKPLLEQKIAKLRSEGKIQTGSSAKMSGGTVLLSWPLRMADNYKEIDGVYSYWYISNFADLNHTEDEDESERLDWMCFTGTAAKNYDQHNGVDIVPYPYPWQMMDDESVDVIAAADGEVIHIFDENTFDRNCAKPHSFVDEPFNSGYYGNFIALLHSDNSITVYGHMKNGTVANLEEGDEVVTGQFLGKVGSSGNSSAPHLHFEYRICEGCGYTEPWYDSEGCNTDISSSRWIDQIPYDEPQLLRITTHDASAVLKDCSDYEAGENEDLNTANHFSSATTLRIGVSMRDYLSGDNFDIDIINGSGSIVESFSHTAISNYQAVSFYYTESLLGYSTGTYRIRVTHDGKTYNHFFSVNCPAAITLTGSHTGVKGYLNGDNIVSTATISGSSSNDVLYQAENYVKLNVGFQAAANCKFRGQIDDCTLGGLKEEEPVTEIQDRQILISPNPNFGIFNLQYSTPDLAAMYFVIRNALGEIIYTSAQYAGGNVISETVNIGSVSKGLYFVEVHEGENVQVEKLIIQ